jgi:hypothetical protein
LQDGGKTVVMLLIVQDRLQDTGADSLVVAVATQVAVVPQLKPMTQVMKCAAVVCSRSRH